MKLHKWIMALSLTMCMFSIWGQQESLESNPPESYIIGGITVEGATNLDINAILLISELKKGERIEVPGEALGRAIRKLWDQNLFSDVQVKAIRFEEENVFLRILVVERPRLTEFQIQGVKKSEAEKVKKALDIYNGKIITEHLLHQITLITKDILKEKKFLKTEVVVSMKDDNSSNNSKIVVVDVIKGKKYKINEVKITGDYPYSEKKMKRLFKKTKEKSILKFWVTSKLEESRLEEDRENVLMKLNSKGYRDAKINSDTFYYHNDKTINVEFDITAGEKYYFGDISWVGNKKYSSGKLDTLVGIKRGEVYDAEKLNERLNISENSSDISSLYMDDGYLFFRLVPVEVSIDSNNYINLEMRMFEGKQATIKRIIIQGNSKTNEHVVRREIRTKPGELFNRSKIIRTQRELSQLGYFDPGKFDIQPIPHPEDGTVDIVYKVAEKGSDQLELQGGWSGFGFVGTIGVSFNNFSVRNLFKKDAWRPVPSGDGQRLSFKLQSNGEFYRVYNVSFTEPWLGGKKPTSLTVSAYRSLQKQGRLKISDPASQYLRITNFSVGIGKRLTWPDDYFTLYGDISYQLYDLNNSPWDFFPIRNGKVNNIATKWVFARNSVSAPIFPRSGSNFSLTFKTTLPYSLLGITDPDADVSEQEKYKWLEYNKIKIATTWYTPLSRDKDRKLVLMTKIGFGFLNYYSKSVGYSPFERFYLGGDGLSGFNLDSREIIRLRGYDDEALSANVGSPIVAKYTSELRYLISPNPSATIFALGFVEAGNAYSNFKSFNPFRVKRSAGVGVRIFLPMFGLLGIDYGWRFDRPDIGAKHVSSNNPGDGKFHFSIGMNLGDL